MSEGLEHLITVQPSLVVQLHGVLAFCSHETSVAALTSLLIYYLEERGNCAELGMEDWRLLCIGPGQPAEVAIYEHAILDVWRKADYDYLSNGNGRAVR